MGREVDVDVVKRGVQAFNRRDLPGLLEIFTPDAELIPFAAKLAGASYVGEEGLRRWLEDLADEWSEWKVEFDYARSMGARVLAVGRIVARGRETGVEVKLPAAFLYTMRGGRIARLESFDDRAEAEASAVTAGVPG